jgi:alkyl sulfatase BDS1-like metallo-beta-lactamase superfamily hydrolase
VVRRRKLPPPAASRVYELTEWGQELEDVVTSLGRWAARSPAPPGDAPIASPDSIILALRARFDPDPAAPVRATYELGLGEDRFRVEVAGDRLEATRGSAERADATIETDNDTIAAVLWGGVSLRAAERSGKLTVAGDRAAAARFLRLFPIPEPIGAGAE